MTILCFAVFLGAVAFCAVTGHTLLWALLLGFALFFLLGLKRGHTPKALLAMAWHKGRDAMIVAPVLLLIGMVAALWRSSGTIAFFLYHGLRSIPPSWFVLMVFLLSATLSFALGTCFGVAGTAGVVLITMARSGGVDLAITAGAVLSGAFFGDRCSPMSSCATLVAATTGTQLYRNVREMLKTAALPTVLTIGFYAVLSIRNPISAVDPEILDLLAESYSLHWSVLLPAVLMLALPLFHVPVKIAMVASALAALILTVTVQQMPLTEALATALRGFAPADPELARILSGSGLTSMFTTAALVFVTNNYAGLLEGMKVLAPAQHLAERLADRLGLFPATAIVSIASGMMLCNQTVVVVMDSQLMGESYRKRGASPTELAMDIANSGVVLVGLIPWAIAVSVPLAMMDVGMSAIPYAALLYFIPLCYLFTKRFFRPGQNRSIPAERT